MTRKEIAAARLLEISRPDRGLWAEGVVFAGIDEAGCGPLAGPVMAGCVIMPEDPLVEGVDDSKKISEKKREMLYERIREVALYARTAMATVEEIERHNIRGATRLAMARAAEGAVCDLFLLDGVDGRITLPAECRAIAHGDSLCYSIAAASILAKVERDRIMRALDEAFPEYGFAKHKGYGTPEHFAAIRDYGLCAAHRPSFLKKYV